MNDDLSRKRLGRGLAALIGEIEAPAAASAPRRAFDGTAPVETVRPNPRNPRRSFSEDELSDLAQSIKEHGLVQPVVVRPGPTEGQYEIVAGERRWRAAQRAGLASIPIIVREVDDRTALELAIVENVQRSDLNPVEEAQGYQQLIDAHGYTQADLGQVIGKSRSHVANTLRLLKLPNDVLGLLADGTLSAGHARTLVTAANAAEIARKIVDQGLSVRQAEALAQAAEQAAHPSRSKEPKDADTLALEKRLSDLLGLAVSIAHRERGGEIRIAYRTLDQLEAVCRRIQN